MVFFRFAMTFPRTERTVYVTKTAAGYASRCQSQAGDELRSDNINGRSASVDEVACTRNRIDRWWFYTYIVCLKSVLNKKKKMEIEKKEFDLTLKKQYEPSIPRSVGWLFRASFFTFDSMLVAGLLFSPSHKSKTCLSMAQNLLIVSPKSSISFFKTVPPPTTVENHWFKPIS